MQPSRNLSARDSDTLSRFRICQSAEFIQQFGRKRCRAQQQRLRDSLLLELLVGTEIAAERYFQVCPCFRQYSVGFVAPGAVCDLCFLWCHASRLLSEILAITQLLRRVVCLMRVNGTECAFNTAMGKTAASWSPNSPGRRRLGQRRVSVRSKGRQRRALRTATRPKGRAVSGRCAVRQRSRCGQ